MDSDTRQGPESGGKKDSQAVADKAGRLAGQIPGGPAPGALLHLTECGQGDQALLHDQDHIIHKVAKAGGSPTALHSTTPITGLHHFGQTVYYSVFGKGLETIAVTGGMPNKFAPSVGARFMADDGVDLFWADEATGPPTGIVHRKPLVGGAVPSPYITGQDSPWDVDIDATNVYWANFGDTSSANGSIMFQPR